MVILANTLTLGGCKLPAPSLPHPFSIDPIVTVSDSGQYPASQSVTRQSVTRQSDTVSQAHVSQSHSSWSVTRA